MRVLAVLLALVPGLAVAEGGPTEESIARLTQAISVAGCSVDVYNQQTVLDAAEMTETEASVIIAVLVERGEAELTEDGMRLTTGSCAPEGKP